MAISLETRVKALETGGGRNCPECGWDGITPLKPECFWDHGEGPLGENIYCGACDRPIQIVVTWGDEV